MTLDADQKNITPVDMIQDRLLVLRNAIDKTSFLECYNDHGERIAQLPLGELKYNLYYDQQTQNFFIQTTNETEQTNLQVYKYQDDSFLKIGDFPQLDLETFTLHDKKIYDINKLLDALYVSVWSHDQHLFDEEITGSLFSDINIYHGNLSNKNGKLEELFKSTYMGGFGSEIKIEMKGD